MREGFSILADYVSTTTFRDKNMLVVDPKALTLLCEQAMVDISHLLRPAHLQVTDFVFSSIITERENS